MGARYYDPALGRWLSEDPAGIAGGLNLYGYAANDPVNNSDPTGLVRCHYVLVPATEVCTPFGCWEDPAYYKLSCDKDEGGGNAGGGSPGGGSQTGGSSGGRGRGQSPQPQQPQQPCSKPSLASIHGAGVELNASAAAQFPTAPGFGLAGDATVGGGVFWGGSQGVTFDDFASLGGVAGGPGVGSPRGPATGVVVGRSAGAGPGVWITNANAVGWVGGVFTTAQLSLGKFSVSLSWSSGIWILSATKSLVGPNSKSFSVFTTNTITTGPTCP